ncbi:hypothetical protein RIF29_29344 [Crotalaria pallida]|uniref:RecF/RecN/SMC N-terminal domain-containing protein n=1 Tax=Crotalaria pallida TaxID=3830 RepID=A0AAN9EGR4_CROPI
MRGITHYNLRARLICWNGYPIPASILHNENFVVCTWNGNLIANLDFGQRGLGLCPPRAEEAALEEKLLGLQEEVNSAELDLKWLKGEETMLGNSVQNLKDEIRKIANKIQDHEKRYCGIFSNIRDLHQHQSNKIAVFGGDKVMNLLRIIERYHQRFKMPPIGPIGAHLTLLNGDKWALAVEHAIGLMLNSFIVTDYKDHHLLKQCAKEAHYDNLQIIIYDFSRPRLMIPQYMLPDTKHPSVLSLLQSDNHIVINVIVDHKAVERTVLVKDYETGKAVAYEQRIQNLKEVYMADGSKIFWRGSVQTHHPPLQWMRTGRLCSSFEDQIKDLEIEASDEQKAANDFKRNKREAEIKLEELDRNLNSVKRVRFNAEKCCTSKKLALEEAMLQHATEKSSAPLSSVDELIEEISVCSLLSMFYQEILLVLSNEVQKKINDDQDLLEDLQKRRHEAAGKADDLKTKFSKMHESTNGEIAALEKAEKELVEIERERDLAKKNKDHYDGVMKETVLPEIKDAEDCYLKLTEMREIFAVSRYSESIAGLRMLYEKKLHKVIRRQQVYKALRQKLELIGDEYRQRFNGHLRRKGISGLIRVDYEEKTLSIEVRMPHDASNRAVQDNRGLSGGERSFSTLCFALALHEMTETPFRAMDEIDIYMDPVTRKISLDTLVDFATAQGSQWIFITPHDTRYWFQE